MMFRRKHSSSISNTNNTNTISNNNNGNSSIVNQDFDLLSSSSSVSLSQIDSARISLPSEDGSSVSTAATGSFTGATSPLLVSTATRDGGSTISNSKRNLLQLTGDNAILNNTSSEVSEAVEESSDDDEDEDHVVAKAKITILSGKHLRNVQTSSYQSRLASGDKDKTKVLHRAGTNPIWTDENKLSLRVRKSDTEILVSVFDYESLRADQLIGKGKIVLADHPHGCVEESISIVLDENDDKKSDGVVKALLTLRMLQRKALSRKDRSKLRSESIKALISGKRKLPRGLSLKGPISMSGSNLATIQEASTEEEAEHEITRFEALIFLIKELNTFEGRIVGACASVFFLLLIVAPGVVYAIYDFLFWFKYLYYLMILFGIYLIYPEALGRLLTFVIVKFATHGYPLSFHSVHIHPYITSDYRLNLRLVVGKFRLGNPPGFEGRDFFSAERVDIELSAPFTHIYNAMTLKYETVHLKKQPRFRRLITFSVHHIEFQGLVIDFQLSKGKLNINELGRAFADAEVRKFIGKDAQIPNLLHVKVIRARNLLAMDSNGLSDPYFIASVRRKSYKSTVIPKTLNPLWVEEYKFAVSDSSAVFHLALYDHDIGSSDFLGQWLITLKWLAIDPLHCNKCDGEVTVDDEGWLKGWFPLCDKKFLRLGKCGDVEIQLKWSYVEPKGPLFEEELPPLKAMDQLIENSNETNLKLGNQQNVVNMLNTIPVLLDIHRITVRGVRFYLEDLFRGRTGASEGLIAKGKSKLSANAVKISILDWTNEFRPKYGDEGITIFKVLYKFFRHLAPKVMGSGKLGQALSQTTSGLAMNWGEDIMNLFKGEFGKVGAVVLAKNTFKKAGAEMQSTAKHLKKKLFTSSNSYVRRLTGEDTTDYMVEPVIAGYLDIAWSKSGSRMRASSGSYGASPAISRSASIGAADPSKNGDDLSSSSPMRSDSISRALSLDDADSISSKSKSMKEVENVQLSSSTKLNSLQPESQASSSFFDRLRRFSSRDSSSNNLQQMNDSDDTDLVRKISAPKPASRSVSFDNSANASKRNVESSPVIRPSSSHINRELSKQSSSSSSPQPGDLATTSPIVASMKPPIPESGKSSSSSWIKNLSLFSNTNLGPRTRFNIMYFEIRGSLFLCRKKSKVASATKNLCIDLTEVAEVFLTSPPSERPVLHIKYTTGKILFLRLPRPAKLALASGSFQTEQHNPLLQDWLEKISKLVSDIQESLPPAQNEPFNSSMITRTASESIDQDDQKKLLKAKVSSTDEVFSDDDDDEPDMFSDEDGENDDDEDDAIAQRKVTSDGSASGSPKIERKRFRFGFGSR